MQHASLQFHDEFAVKAGNARSQETLNFYVPPAYTKQGDELPSGKG